MALMKRERGGRAGEPFRVIAGRIEAIEPQVDLRSETRLGSPPIRSVRPLEMAPASLIAVRLASRMRRPASRNTMRVVGGPAATARRPSVCHPSASARMSGATAAPGPPRRLPESCRASPRGQRRHQATHRPAVQHYLVLEAELPDEGRYEARVEVRPWPVSIRSTGVACNRPREVDGDHRAELPQVRNEVIHMLALPVIGGTSRCTGAPGGAAENRIRADIMHVHAAHARRHAAQPRPLLRPDAPVVVSHGDASSFPHGSRSKAGRRPAGWWALRLPSVPTRRSRSRRGLHQLVSQSLATEPSER